MKTDAAEITKGIWRFSTFVPEIAPPLGFTFNQFLVEADEPFLFHCGPRAMFPLVSAALAGVMPLDRLRWISFGHVESDECGAMNLWLAAAPNAQVVHGATACMVSLNDLADRPPRILAHGETLDLGGRRIRWLDTPHVPHAWESGVVYEETSRTLFCGDLFTHLGNGPAVTSGSIVEPAVIAEEAFRATALTPQTAPTIRMLAALQPTRLALMHGSSFEGDAAGQLTRLANYYEQAHAAKGSA